MNDEEKLEAELARMTPLPLDDGLLRRLEAAAQERLTPGDRLLAAWAGMGALAAAVIALIAVWQMTTPQPPAMSRQETASHQSLEAEIRQMLAAR